eukprot:symbB.v1.2.021279.t1/scaffold1831.1/size99527/2
MGGLLDCFPIPSGAIAPAGPATRANGKAWADVVVKIGGSACTRKAEFETLNVGALSAISSQLSALPAEGLSLAVVHGAGSFGHHVSNEYGLSKGTSEAPLDLSDRLREGFAKGRLSVTTLNKHVTTALLKEGLPAVSISPCPFVGTEKKKLRGGRLEGSMLQGTKGLLQRGFVPVVHGDAVLDDAQGVAILGSDVCLARRPGTGQAILKFWVSHGAAPKEEGSLQVELPLVSKVCDGCGWCFYQATQRTWCRIGARNPLGPEGRTRTARCVHEYRLARCHRWFKGQAGKCG